MMNIALNVDSEKIQIEKMPCTYKILNLVKRMHTIIHGKKAKGSVSGGRK